MNFFIEGLQGSGKSTLLKKLAEIYPDYQTFYEGDYSPVELAWCAYVIHPEYEKILEKYKGIREEIESRSFREGDRRIIPYTQIITDSPGFHKDLERYEIYNNRVPFETFKTIILERYGSWHGDQSIFECSLFQNIVEDMILFRDSSDLEILDFYEEIRNVFKGKKIHILYLETENIAGSIDVIRRERSDNQGRELWFPMLCAYFNESPFAQKRGLSGEAALLEHLSYRQELELRICREIFPHNHTILQSKQYRISEILR